MAIEELVGQKNYPCLPAQSSLKQKEFRIGVYADFGSGMASRKVATDLEAFRIEQRTTKAPYLSFWAVWPNSKATGEDEFEQSLWSELSCLASADESNRGWDKRFSSDPQSASFCFSFGGDAFFVVGLHPGSSRLARRFKYQALVFNLYDQFEDLEAKNQYTSIVKANRERDMKFQGSVNPTVAKFADTWEAIQFSGRQNNSDWQCPFRHGAKPITRIDKN